MRPELIFFKKKGNPCCPSVLNAIGTYFLFTTLIYSSRAMVIEGVPGFGAWIFTLTLHPE
jgi:hypothetical protein